MLWIEDTQGNLVNLEQCSQIACVEIGTPIDNMGSVKVCTPEHTIQVFTGSHDQCKTFVNLLYSWLLSMNRAIPTNLAETTKRVQPNWHD